MEKFDSWKDYLNFEKRVKAQQRFIRGAEDTKFLEAVLSTSKKRHISLPNGRILWRAQHGHGWRYEDNIDDLVESPHEPERMKPLKDRAKEGRANPKGISYLYLATTQDTAMSEIRPWIGAYVSCGAFVIQRDLTIVDLSRSHAEKFPITDILFSDVEQSAENKEKAVWSCLDNSFSKPITTQDDDSEYAPTQIIAELFKSNGMDGIAYKSNFGGDEGYNVVLFNPEEAELKSCHLFKVKKAQFEFKEDTNPYYTIKKQSNE